MCRDSDLEQSADLCVWRGYFRASGGGRRGGAVFRLQNFRSFERSPVAYEHANLQHASPANRGAAASGERHTNGFREGEQSPRDGRMSMRVANELIAT